MARVTSAAAFPETGTLVKVVMEILARQPSKRIRRLGDKDDRRIAIAVAAMNAHRASAHEAIAEMEVVQGQLHQFSSSLAAALPPPARRHSHQVL